jgi:hypothetical protein
MNPAAVNDAVREIESLGLPRNEIRTVGEPLDLSVSGVLSIPHIDFETSLKRELLRIGATRVQTDAYLEGLRKRGILVFATGLDEQVDRAAEVMNRYGAAQIEESSGPEPQVPRAAAGRMTPMHDSPVQAGRVREPSGGAAFFVW